jgi:hypothetical protein
MLRTALRWLSCLALGTVTGCTLLWPVQGPVVPHANQQQWIDEAAVINMVTRYVYECRFDSRRPLAERQYAARLRQWYDLASSGGKDADGGQRAVNFVHRVHLDAKGSRDLWEHVLSLARESTPGQNGLALPAAVK